MGNSHQLLQHRHHVRHEEDETGSGPDPGWSSGYCDTEGKYLNIVTMESSIICLLFNSTVGFQKYWGRNI